ncbi:MAG: GTP pyrophosphokinase [Bacillota bacterium]|nr:GTP pyrophosphokinase [Bacillota bacterium]MDW7676747.1 GTP pyrophosphokinase [Bacillota bacterium]
MYPLIGGTPGRPDDWRIKTLVADKGLPELGSNAVSITIWESARDERSLAKEESMLEKAIEIALKAHQGQTDKAGAPYILHPLRVMLAGETETEQICGILHDVVEDSNVSLEDLKMEGFSDEVLQVLELLTRKESESYDEFIDRVMTNGTAMRVKLADLKDNMDLTRIEKITEADLVRVRKYRKAHDRIILKLAELTR